MAGLIIDELYKNLADQGSPYPYTAGIEPLVDGILEEMGFISDQLTTWWEVTDALFISGFPHEAMLAQRYAMPLLADAAAICRTPIIEDLYGKMRRQGGKGCYASSLNDKARRRGRALSVWGSSGGWDFARCGVLPVNGWGLCPVGGYIHFLRLKK